MHTRLQHQMQYISQFSHFTYEKIGNNIKVQVGTNVVSTFVRHGVFTIMHKKKMWHHTVWLYLPKKQYGVTSHTKITMLQTWFCRTLPTSSTPFNIQILPEQLVACISLPKLLWVPQGFWFACGINMLSCQQCSFLYTDTTWSM